MSTDLQQRVEALEKSNKNLKLVVGALVLFTLYGMKTMHFGGIPLAINAQSFIVRSPDGVSTAAIEPSGISYYTKSGQITARLEARGENMGWFVNGVKLGSTTAAAPVVTTTTSTTR